MPLIKVPKGASNKRKNVIIGQNISEMVHAGRSHKRAVEIAGAAGNREQGSMAQALDGVQQRRRG